MATYEMAPNDLITCPYDSTHRLKRSRYQLHVAKCELNHLDKKKEPCPFNAQHKLDPGTKAYHLMHCPNRSVLDKKLVASAENNTFKGHTGVPSYHAAPLPSRENWDVELTSQPSSYQPSIEPPSGGIRLNFDHMQPAERRHYYRSLHGRNSDEDNGELEVELERGAGDLPELRKPITKSLAQMPTQNRPVHELQNVGLGRGHGVPSASPRIAANIFGDQPNPMRQPRSAPNIPGFGRSTPGGGRGIFINGANQHAGVTAFHDVDNNVGLGRAAKR